MQPVLGKQRNGIDRIIRAQCVEARRRLRQAELLRRRGELIGVDVTEHNAVYQGMRLQEGNEVAREGTAADDTDSNGHGPQITRHSRGTQGAVVILAL